MRTPAAWPLHPAPGRRPPETSPEAPSPRGRGQSEKTAEPLLRRPVAEAEPSPNPPSLETILAATSLDEPTNRRGRLFVIAGLASLGVLVPCLVGAALVMDQSSLALPWLDRTEASLPERGAAPGISAAGESVIASREPRASAEQRHQDAASTEPLASPPPHSPAFAAPPATAPTPSATSETAAGAPDQIAAVEPEKSTPSPQPVAAAPPPAPPLSAPSATETPTAAAPAPSIADADRRIATLERERDTLAAEVDRLEHHREATAPAQVDTPAPPLPPRPADRSDPDPSAALASLPEGMPARVLIRYPRNNTDARRRAESLADALKRQGVEVADLRESAAAVRTGVSFFYARDAGVAQRIGGLVGVAPERRPQMKDGLMARPGAVELSFSDESRSPVITTSRKESVHE